MPKPLQAGYTEAVEFPIIRLTPQALNVVIGPTGRRKDSLYKGMRHA